MSDLKTIIGIITATMPLLKINKSKQTRKNLRMAHRNYKDIRRIMKKDGISEKEKEQLEGMLDLLVSAQNKLI